MAITPLPTPPSRQDDENFDDRAEAFLGAMPDMVEEINGALDDIDGAVAAAQAAATAATTAPGTNAASATSLTLGLGPKTLTVQTGKLFVKGHWVAITDSANGVNQMIGRVDGYTSGTGELIVTVTRSVGAGTTASWVVALVPAPDESALPKTGGTMAGPIAEMGNASSIKDPAGNAQGVGYRNIPTRLVTETQTLALTDVGRGISITTGGIVVPNNSAVAFAIGDTVTIYNNSSSSQTITPASGVTLRLAGSNTNGSRSIAQRGLVTLMKVNTNEWAATGAGLS